MSRVRHKFSYSGIVLFAFSIIFLTISPTMSAPEVIPKLEPTVTTGFRAYVLQRLNQQPPDKRTALAEYIAYNGYYIDAPEFWGAISDPKLLVRGIAFLPEPYSPSFVDALERSLNTLEGRNAWIAAAILYRYGRPAGGQYLVHLVEQQGNIDAATIFAENHDTAKIDLALQPLSPTYSFKSIGQRSLNSGVYDNYLRALAYWPDPKVTKVLSEEFKRQPLSNGMMTALALHHITEASPLLRSLYFRPNVTDVQKIYSGAALVRLDGADTSREILNYLLALCDQKSGEVNDNLRLYAVQSCGELEIKESIPTLQALIKNYETTHTPAKIMAFSQFPAITIEDRLVIKAAQALAQLNDTSSRNLIQSLLMYLSLQSIDKSYWGPVADALLDLGEPPNQISKYTGSEWMQRELSKRKLPSGLSNSSFLRDIVTSE